MLIANCYEAVPFHSLKETTQKAVYKFWDKIYKFYGVDSNRNGHVYTQPLPVGALATKLTNMQGVANVTLEALALTRSQEVFEQLPIGEAKVEALTKDLCSNILYVPVVLGVLKGTEADTTIIISGRHRTCAFLTLAQVIPNWSELVVGVYIDDRYRNQRDLIAAVEKYNVSRTVTATEKAQYRLTQKGMTAGVSFWDIMSQFSSGELGTADIGSAVRVASRNYFGEDHAIYVDEEGTMASGAALGNFGNGALSAFSAKSGKSWSNPLVTSGRVSDEVLKQLKKTLTTDIQYDGQELPVLGVFLSHCLNSLQQNWAGLYEQLKVNPSDSGVNFARNSAALGRAIGVKVLEGMMPQLLSAAEALKTQAAEKKSKAKQKSVATQLKSMYQAYAHLESLGASLPVEHLQAALGQMAQTAEADLGLSPADFFMAMKNGGVLPEQPTSTLPAPAAPPAAMDMAAAPQAAAAPVQFML